MKRNTFISVIIILFFIILTVFSSEITENAYSTLKNCFANIIPSLFPFMVTSSMLASSGASILLGKILPVSRIFSLSRCSSAPIIMGSLCGFPLGAKSSVELYSSGYISKSECETLLSITSNAGPSFVIFVIGKIYFQSLTFGIFLYLAQLICNLFTGLLINNVIFRDKKRTNYENIIQSSEPFGKSLADAIRKSSLECIFISGFITFFSILSRLTDEIVWLPRHFALFIKAILEFSSASLEAGLYPEPYNVFFAGLSIGFSGLSVLFQTLMFTYEFHLSLKKYICSKALSGLLLGTVSMLYVHYNPIKKAGAVFSVFSKSRHISILSICILIIIMLYILTKKRENSKTA